MNANFDPYRDWLGLSLRQRPTYYELLGLERSVSEDGKIAAAADRALARVRSCRPGPNAPQWSALLDEIKAAKQCLLDPASRRQYDAQLDAATAEQAPRAPVIVAKPSKPFADPNLLPPGMSLPAGSFSNDSKAAGEPLADVSPTTSSINSASVNSASVNSAGSVVDPAMQPYQPQPVGPPGWLQPDQPDPMQPVLPATHSAIRADAAVATELQPIIDPHRASRAKPQIRSKSVASLQRRRRQRAGWGLVFFAGSLMMVALLAAALKFGLAEKIQLATSPTDANSHSGAPNDRWNPSEELAPTMRPGSFAELNRRPGGTTRQPTATDSIDNTSSPIPDADKSTTPSNVDAMPLSDDDPAANPDASPNPPMPQPEMAKPDPDPEKPDPEKPDPERPQPEKSEPDKPAPDNSTTGTPTPTRPASAEPAAKPQPSAADLKSLSNALKAAREAIGEQEFATAERQLSKAETLAKAPDDEQQVLRLRQLGG